MTPTLMERSQELADGRNTRREPVRREHIEDPVEGPPE
jgi:hypothetical protein